MELSNFKSVLCLTCLSVDRKMIRLEELHNVYKQIIAVDYIISGNLMHVDVVCWECHAYLLKIHKFQSRVRRAQELLNIKQDTDHNLSTLAINENPNIDILYQMGEYIVKEENMKKETNTEEETIMDDNDTYDHNGYNDMNVDPFDEHELKTENTKDDEVKGKLFDNLNSNFKDVSFTKVEHESNGKQIVFEEWNSYNENRKFKSVGDKKCYNALMQRDIVNPKRFVNNESAERDKKSMKHTNNKRICEHNNKRGNKISTKCRHINDIDAVFYEEVKEKTPYITETEIIDKKAVTQKKEDLKRRLLIPVSALYGCKVCGSFVRNIEREYHMKKHKKIIQCVSCELVFDGRRVFFKHYNEWHTKYICDKCGMKFKRRLLIEKHIRKIHTAVTCEECGKTFPSHRHWRNHHKHMHVASPAYCVECNLHFPNVVRYKQHLWDNVRHKRRPKVRIPCPDCEQVFTKPITMRRHREYVHLRQYNHRCQVCDKKFISKYSLARHVFHVHEGVPRTKDKICYICGKGFSANRILMNHLHTHTGERPHACELCPARFIQDVALAAHRRAIHPEAGPMTRPGLRKKFKSFGCELCPVRCTTAERLEQHKRDLHLISKASPT